jgi:hypothetical protein
MMDRFIDNQNSDHASNIHEVMYHQKSSTALRVPICLVRYAAAFNVQWMEDSKSSLYGCDIGAGEISLIIDRGVEYICRIRLSI